MNMKTKLIVALIMLIVAVSIAQAQSVSRNLPDAPVGAGTNVTVEIAVDHGAATFYAIDEAVPQGWSVTGATGGDYAGAQDGRPEGGNDLHRPGRDDYLRRNPDRHLRQRYVQWLVY